MSKAECIGCPHLVITREEGAAYKECQFGAGIHEGYVGCVKKVEDKAEIEARKAYPDNPYYGGRSAQRLFAEGYRCAEKDNALTAEDRHYLDTCVYAIKETFKDEDNPHRIAALDWLNSQYNKINQEGT